MKNRKKKIELRGIIAKPEISQVAAHRRRSERAVRDIGYANEHRGSGRATADVAKIESSSQCRERSELE